MLNGLFRQDLNTLVNKDSRPTSPTKSIPDAPGIVESRGSGKPFTSGGFSSLTDARNAQKSPTLASARMEVITVWSSIIITEDGAFEVPPGWPNDGSYPGGGTPLDTSVSYYMQKRVHLVTYQNDQGTELTEDRFLVPFAAPYEGLGFMQGLNSYVSANASVVLHLDYVDGIGRVYNKVLDRIQEIASLVGNLNINRL